MEFWKEGDEEEEEEDGAEFCVYVWKKAAPMGGRGVMRRLREGSSSIEGWKNKEGECVVCCDEVGGTGGWVLCMGVFVVC